VSYRWPVDPQDLFTERYAQMLGTGLPIGDVDSVRASVVEMWSGRPGGWVHEWSVLAAQYAAQERHDLAMLAYGWAKFPVLADDAKRAAFKSQLEQYVLASTDFRRVSSGRSWTSLIRTRQRRCQCICFRRRPWPLTRR
jgi:esterase FrsA